MAGGRAASATALAVSATALALLAAALFGLAAPLAKRLVASVGALELAGLLYLGAGLLAAVLPRRREARLQRADAPWLAGVVACGGIAGPVLLMVGLERTSASAASLLLNLEVVFTAAIAALWLKEPLGRRGLGALALVVAGAALAGYTPGGATSSWAGPLAIAGACAAWGLDNAFTQKLSARDPLAVVRVKGLAAGAVSFSLGLLTGGHLPSVGAALAGLLVGAAGYGLSMALYVRAVRDLGAARVSMLFATGPFLGALAAFPLLGERPTALLGGAALLLALGVWLLARERHEHLHHHDALEHEHRHVHDEHHQHAHDRDYGPEPHSHPHQHDPLTHAHPHTPDLHHRHKH